jgi:hypothetical protein
LEELKGAEKEEEPVDATRETFNTSSLENSSTGVRESWDVKSYKSSSSTKGKIVKISLADRL